MNQKNQKNHPSQEVVVMTVSLDGGDGAAVKKFLAEHQYTLPSAHDKGMVFARALNVRGVPATVIIDRQQNVVASGTGPLALDRPDVKQLIQKLLAQ